MELSSVIKTTIKRSGAVSLYYILLNKYGVLFPSFLLRFSPRYFVKYRYKKAYGKRIHLKNPRTFDEKLLWLMLFWRHPLKIRCGDKYTMRLYVQENGWGHVLPELQGVYENSNDINFDLLPDKFVLKCTHGCGFNIICKNKEEFDQQEAKNKLDKWMKIDYSKYAGELHYNKMKPKIICEQFLDDLAGDLPVDYKVYCFQGKAHCTLTVLERRDAEHHALYDFYDREWKTKLPYSKSSLLADRNIPKPEAYEEIILAAEALSKPFPFVRMDFYNIHGKAVLGEMTFTPSGCIGKGYTELAQNTLGDLIKLPPKLLSR